MSNITCNRGCGISGLSWKTVQGQYKLFNNNGLLHICNDGQEASKAAQEKATASIMDKLGVIDAADIPEAEPAPKKKPKDIESLSEMTTKDPGKMFTITTTANGIAITGDDKHNAIYMPKVAVPELVKALVDFIHA